MIAESSQLTVDSDRQLYNDRDRKQHYKCKTEMLPMKTCIFHYKSI
ncbi:MAG: hypothetical protein JGK01_24695 [Microcoleus sp. PH2017_03_ELD_O_A]|nr:hypothetical protein [Microcoleus sp. PH2017_03_ELD_O_A]